jgi:putative ubiquitin-RnfH superfamily antitoxin RatB of RatAB toxin-antitoxin module
MHVTVVFSSAPRQVLEWELQLPEGATVQDAVRASAVQAACPEFDLDAAELGVWGRKAQWNQPLRERDRIEIYRGLKVDPKIARRERFRKQGARTAGLFSNKKPGAKPG